MCTLKGSERHHTCKTSTKLLICWCIFIIHLHKAKCVLFRHSRSHLDFTDAIPAATVVNQAIWCSCHEAMFFTDVRATGLHFEFLMHPSLNGHISFPTSFLMPATPCCCLSPELFKFWVAHFHQQTHRGLLNFCTTRSLQV